MVSHLLAAGAAAATHSPDAAPVKHALALFALFGTIAALLGLFFIVVVLLLLSYGRRLRSDHRRTPSVMKDAWREAGRRLEVDDAEEPT
ncbi:MAG: hypothetical protein IH804_00565 [Planctomycetes bacterium]|nr:hypothetical protein [Planctomycetota bacterium]